MKNIFINGIKITPLRADEVVEEIIKAIKIKNNSPTLITFLNAYVFCLSKKDKELKTIISNSKIVVADGVSLVLAALLLKRKKIPRSIMTKVFDEFLVSPHVPPCKAILVGVTAEEAQKAKERINNIAKYVQIESAYSGFLTHQSYSDIFKDHHNIDLVFVGMSTPKSEYICKLAEESCANAIVWHIGGGTIKCYAGTKRRAPEWTSTMGLEWLHRFIYEKHTRKRYLIHNLEFIYFISIGMLKSFSNLRN